MRSAGPKGAAPSPGGALHTHLPPTDLRQGTHVGPVRKEKCPQGTVLGRPDFHTEWDEFGPQLTADRNIY